MAISPTKISFDNIPASAPFDSPCSKFWEILLKDKSDDGANLQRAVKAVVKSAKKLSAEIVRDMPLYTDHGPGHLRNVLHLMETFATKTGIEEMGPLGCGLSIIAAYIHDLGMTLSAEERANLRNPETDFGRAYQTHEASHAAHCREIERLRASPEARSKHNAELIDAHLKAEFLRRRHSDADPRKGPIAVRLGKILSDAKITDGIRYADRDWTDDVVAIAASHGHAADWLRSIHCGRDEAKIRPYLSATKRTNLALPALLLRLADIVDFDRSRTPSILFYHLGLGELGDEELAKKTGRDVSRQEWMKHLAVTSYGLEFSAEGPVLRYVCNACPHPAVEHSVRQFAGWIESESAAVAQELRAIHAAEAIAAPARVELKIEPRKKDGRPVYLYDPGFKFNLDEDQVMRLLMGANLYGDPAVCIRELLQNSLDALELRQARLRRKAARQGGAAVDDLNPGESLEAALSWGEEEGRRFIRVSDNGTGMTREQIKRYFATVGRSYYRSSEFESEGAELQRQGHALSPISQFGIGVLSCFMVAERLTVRTHPGASAPGSTFEVTGPGKLFVLRDGDLPAQGTEVTLWLRDHIGFESWPESELLARTRREFGYSLSERDQKLLEKRSKEDRRETMADLEGRVPRKIHPAFEAVRHVVWPLFPVRLRGPGRAAPLVIGPEMVDHFRRFRPLDATAATEEANAWEWTGPLPQSLGWKAEQWTDAATGSRIGWVAPTGPEGAAVQWTPARLAALCERQLRGGRRERYLVRGVEIDDTGPVDDDFHLGAGLGSCLWVDLRGAAAPGVTTARDKAYPPADLKGWEQAMRELTQRWVKAMAKRWTTMIEAGTWLLAVAWDRAVASVPVGELPNVGDRGIPLFQHMGKAWGDELSQRVLASTRWLSSESAHALDRARALDRALARARTTLKNFGSGFRLLPSAVLTAEAFFPDLPNSFPALQAWAERGQASERWLSAPTIVPRGGVGEAPRDALREHDFVFPLSVSPGGNIRRKLGQEEWARDWRRWHSVLSAPFLLPDAKFVREWSGVLGQLAPGEWTTVSAFIPRLSLWETPFSAWKPEEDARAGYTVVWEVPHRRLRWMLGLQPRKKVQAEGLPFEKFAESKALKDYQAWLETIPEEKAARENLDRLD